MDQPFSVDPHKLMSERVCPHALDQHSHCVVFVQLVYLGHIDLMHGVM